MSKSYLTMIVAFFMLNACTTSHKKPVQDKPNIIYILADDLGYADIGPYGQSLIKTPALDEMAQEGMVFTQHYAGNTVCAPSRCCLMTGLHPGHAHVRGNKQHIPYGQLPIPENTVTVSSLLNKAGYKTGMIGKWGLGNVGTSGDPSKHGWDMYYAYLDQVLAHNYYPEFLIRNGEKEFLNNKVHYLPDTLWHKGLGSYSTEKNVYSHDLFTEAALDFIRENSVEPFFLYLPYTIPHDNGEAPEGERMEVPDFGIYADSLHWNREIRAYAAMISRMDRDIGTILDLLKELKIDERTLVIFTSDNGPMPGEIFTDFFNSNGPLRGGKRDMYEGGLRVPHIAWWPQTIAAGSVSGHISAFWDFLPTACDIAGIESPKDIDGISYLPELKGEEQDSVPFLYWESPLNEHSIALRLGNWKAVQMGYGNPIELYDLDTDPGEAHDISFQEPELLKKLEQIIKEAHTPSVHFPLPAEL